MNVMDLVAKLTLDNVEYLNGLSNSEKEANGFTSRAKSGIKALSKAGVVAVGAVTTAAGALLKTSISGYADYEQMLGGVRKLYGNMGLSLEEYAKKTGRSVNDVKGEWSKLEKAQSLVLDNANKAYLTSGMSANEYMSMATTFSASLIQSLKGDTVAAAKQTDVAMRAISDNFNTFGGDIGMIQGAFAGFAKGNFGMLDNLKLGYQGTKDEMERLIADANEYAKANGMAADLSINSFSDIVTAIDLIQQKQNIANTTANEAATTIAGSFMMTKAAWQNLVTGFADPDSDIGTLVSNVMASAGTAVGNLIPAISRGIQGMGDAINKMLPQIVSGIPTVITDILIPLVTQGFTVVRGVVVGLVTELPSLMSTLFNSLMSAMGSMTTAISTNLPTMLQEALTGLVGITTTIREKAGEFVNAGLTIIQSIAQGIIQNIPTIIQTVPTIISNIAGIINDNAPKLLATGLQIIVALAKGIVQAFPVLLANIPKIITAIWDAFTAVNWIALGGSIIKAIGSGIKAIGKSIPNALKSLAKGAINAFKGGGWRNIGGTVINLMAKGVVAFCNLIPNALKKVASLGMKAFTSISWGTVGKNILTGIARGVVGGVSILVNAARNAATSALDAIKHRLGINSPSKVFKKEVGHNIALGIAAGINDGTSNVTDAMAALNSKLEAPTITPIANDAELATPPAYWDNVASNNGRTEQTSGDVFNFNLYYTGDNDANDMLKDVVRGVRRYRMAGAI